MLHDLSALNNRFGDDAEAGLRFALSGALGRVALVSSFGAESAVLLHLVSRIAPETPVLFIDTLMLFPETLAYQRDLAARLDLRDLRTITPDRAALFERDPDNLLHRADPDTCCALRKAQPLEGALQGFDGWITGRKRYQGSTRSDLNMFERDGDHLKINPLAGWTPADIANYMDRHDLPRHPLVAHGYLSIGCAPCTAPVATGEDPRAGRWRGQDKVECGIHIANGRVIRRQAS
ncbi:phosphoadenylyl-sulfate reductase [Roseinatronobacter alkalisoli]|uniref:Adenosine 5'-phosphosulfate reductase n=1 Tax=Roseinatronobacter alkalisoli TaxID=3028235 RepID=A0ABT5T791_9RHOB|nr:phosphoadenylyl-sulfate reductase [Roseinatronobacter sp. HJB301]MDD7970550.1 phosphoadenylyl-sulfate reductase [Roseinatronobacter sp. HJB301]